MKDEVERLAIPALAKVLADNPEIFSDDPHAAHKAASPQHVDVARLKAHNRAMAALAALSACGLELNKAGTREALVELSTCSVKVEPMFTGVQIGPDFPARYEAAIMAAIKLGRREPTDADRQWAMDAIKRIEVRSLSDGGE